MGAELLNSYLSEIHKKYISGDATEISYYGILENLFLQFAEENKIKNIHVTTIPKRTEAGNPDFRIWDGKVHVTGYVEAKDIGTDLDKIENSEQLERYIKTFPNVILTNYLEFRLYRDGEKIKKVFIEREVVLKKLKAKPVLENETEFTELMNLFFSFSLPEVKTAKKLATELAKRTRFLRDEVVSIELAEEEKEGKKSILGFYEAFKKYLIHSLSPEQFADLYSQTLAYGLFAARTRADKDFNRELAFKFIPNTIGILKDVFRFISLEDPPDSLKVVVDDISEVLKVTDVKKILHEFDKEGKGQDPIIHFYETFLKEYDPKLRERRGVYYTPEPVVGYIVRSIHKILKTHFNLADGLASPEVTLLDPAGGTLTFPAEAIKVAVKEYKEKHGGGGINNFIKKQILKNFYAFELMMAPYAIGHLKMSFLFEELGYKLKDDERFNLYLTNTLDNENIQQIDIPGLSSLSEESKLAGEVKKEKPVLVILGNPPYSGISSNMNEWTDYLLKNDVDGAQSYYTIDGQPLGEKKVWLQNDYVKFLRFAQWKISKEGFGVVGMITDNSYIDNVTFRGMRQSLMKTFNEIYIHDLHGNSNKKEKTPKGGKDENVFDILQGVSIVLFIKEKNKKGCKIYHKDKFGLREEKYNWLDKNEFAEKNYKKLKPESPWYFFVPWNTDNISNYSEWKSINEIFPINVTGIVTARDNLAIDFKKDSLKNKIMMFRNLQLDDEIVKEGLGISENYQWKITEQRKLFSKVKNWEEYFDKILYRPFDIRDIYYQENIVFRMRSDVIKHMTESNLSLCYMRQFSGDLSYTHFFVSEFMVDNRTFYSSRGVIQQAPLYIYPDKEKHDLFSTSQKEKEANINPEILELLKTNYKTPLLAKERGRGEVGITPEEILYYIYGIFYSNTYREKYAEFLKIDFPRVPFTKNYKLFKQIGELGKELTELHLMKSGKLDKPVSKYEGKGENDKIEKVNYNEEENRIYINSEKYFTGITPELWNYHIGGYQVLNKYLKDRKDRQMEDPRYYSKIVTAIKETIELQKQLDKIYDEVEKSLIN